MTIEGHELKSERAPGLDGATLCEAFQISAEAYADRPALSARDGSLELTWAEYAEKVRRVAGGLAKLGVGSGDTVALMLINRPEFHVVDTAALHLGAIPFSIYNSSPREQVEYLFGNAGNRVVITEPQFFDVIRSADAPALEHVVSIDELEEAELNDFEQRWRAVEPDDFATLIYTSGTTGPPKGVQITHGNLMFGLRAWPEMIPMRPAGRVLSYLPCAHIADRFLAHYCGIATGSTITTVEEPAKVIEALAQVKPTGWLAVPRIWEKLKAALEGQGVADPAALPAAEKVALCEKLGFGEADWLGTGAAPIPREVLEYFLALELPILEGWAMSESACSGTINPIGEMRVGTVGKLLPGIEGRIADDGEFLIRGPNVMPGYRGDPEKTAEAIDAAGWLHTGDVAEIDDDGYVKIVDRKKELIINAAGKNMSPANIEQKLKGSSPLIGQACAIGDGRPYNVALLVIDPDGAAAYAGEHGLGDASPEALADDERVQERIAAAVEAANARMSRVEQIKRFKLLPVDWLPDSEELTPTMKLKRRGVHRKYAEEIEALYG